MLHTRLLTAAVLLALFLAALFRLPATAWTLVLLPVLWLGACEWAQLAGLSRRAGWLYASVMSAAGLLIHFPAPQAAAPLQAGALVFWLLVAPVWLARGWTLRGAALAAVGVLVLLATWLALARLQSTAAALLACLGIVWIADTCAYLAGRRWGRRKLAPGISPGKSWEGVAGAAIAVVVYYLVLQWVWAAPPPALRGMFGAGVVLLLFVLSIEGDLFESWLKRRAGLKDSGTLLPGHGGVLDRIDGLLATLPAVALLLG